MWRFVVALSVLSSCWGVWPARADDKPSVVELWPGKAPDEPGGIGAEKVVMSPKLDRRQVEVTESTRMVTNVTKPTITIYRPAKEKDTGTAIIICPGGGYWNLFWQLEGEEVAAWLNSIGVTGIILKYRVPRRPDEPKGYPARRPLQDAQRAVSLIRSRAKEWGIDPERIGMVGFSAGGHLAFATATNFDKRTYEPLDDIDKVSCRPNFAISVYSGYLKAKEKDELAPGLRIPKGTPPVFLAHGGEDLISDPGNSVVAYLALKRAGVPAELHVYANTAHDFAVRPSDRPCSTWTRSCADWLRHLGFLKRPSPPQPGAALQVLQTPSGVRFGLLGARPSAPAPTLFMFASDIATTLGNDHFNMIGRLLARDGFLCVALDLPCHGKDQKAGHSAGLAGWRTRLEGGEELVPGFVKQAVAVLDHLVKEGYTDPGEVAACGTSRGGFIALHFAAAEPRVRAVAAFAPVTDLLALREFAGMEKHEATRALALADHADKLAGRAVWLCIGNNDGRVDTDRAIAFTRKVVAASAAHKRPADVELRVTPTVGHRIHATAHEEAAAWMLTRLKGGG